MKKLGSFAIGFIAALLVYIIMVGRFGLPEIIIGIVLSAAAGLISLKYLPLDGRCLNPIRWWAFIVYIPFFLLEMIKANIHIALIVLNPTLPIKPEIKKAKTKLKTDAGRLMLSTSITLTPGTLSIDIHGDEVEIHCVNSDLTAREIMEPFEKRIMKITE